MLRISVICSFLYISIIPVNAEDVTNCLNIDIVGADYPVAREALIMNGWSPVYFSPPFENAPYAEWVQVRNFAEVESCAGAGVAPCRFVFQSNNDPTITLNIFTVGEVVGGVTSFNCVKAV